MSGVDDGHLMTVLRYLNSGAKGLLVLFTTVWNFINKTAFFLETKFLDGK